MKLAEIEKIVIQCLVENLKLSGEPIPNITPDTKPGCDLSGFDSIRTLEVLINIEEKLNCELSPDKVFLDKKMEDVAVSTIAKTIHKIKKELNS
ncbi:MAG: acyl carrier protein [Gammaproteobacteria bacterium]